MKKCLIFLILVLSFSVLLAGCGTDREAASSDKNGSANEESIKNGDQKSNQIIIVATLFPQYDFARQIAGDKAEVTLLLPPGVESHSYEPTPSDIIRINESDLFIYTGKNMEAWSQKIIDGMVETGSKSLVLDVSRGIKLETTETLEEELEQTPEGTKADHEADHEHLYDPHIWTDPLMAKEMVSNIETALCQLDPVNAEYYKENAESYRMELDGLDEELRAIVSNGNRKEIVFGSRFALFYFAKRYGLEYEAAFDSCSAETEPSAKTVAELMARIKEENIPVIYYAELEDPKVAKSISEETGAKMLLLHSCHNISKKELEKGETYLSLMEQNARNLKEGLE